MEHGSLNVSEMQLKMNLAQGVPRGFSGSPRASWLPPRKECPVSRSQAQVGFLGRRTCKGIFLVSVFISSLFPLVSFPKGWVLSLQRPCSLLSRTDLLFVSAAGGRPRLRQGCQPRDPQSQCACPQFGSQIILSVCSSLAQASPRPRKTQLLCALGQPFPLAGAPRSAGWVPHFESTRDVLPVNTHLKLTWLQVSARQQENRPLR